MSAYKSDFLNILAERGFIHQISEPDALDAQAKAGAISAYIGFDCTAASLHDANHSAEEEPPHKARAKQIVGRAA